MSRKIVFIVASLGCVFYTIHFVFVGQFDRAVEFLALYALLIIPDWN